MGKLAIVLVVLFAGCASAPVVLTEFETVEVEVPVRIPIPPEMLVHPEACFFPSTGKLYIFDIDEWVACAAASLREYAAGLNKIRALQN